MPEEAVAGRAEFEDVSAREEFEGHGLEEEFGWIDEQGFSVGILTGPRGSGKTFALRKYAARREGEIAYFELDKTALTLSRRMEPPRARLLIVDDLHYLLQAARLSELRPGTIAPLSIQRVLSTIESLIASARRFDTRVLFVTDEGLSGLSWSLKDDAQRRRFLDILKDAPVDPDDCALLYRETGNIREVSPSTHRFRSALSRRALTAIRSEFGITDLPITLPNVAPHERDTKGVFVTADKEFHVEEGGGEFRLERSILTHETWRGGPFRAEGAPMDELVAPIRQLSALAEARGKLDRASLGITSGQMDEIDGIEGWYYPASAVRGIRFKVSKLYIERTSRGVRFWDFMRAVLAAETDEDAEAAFLHRAMQEE